MQLPSPRLASLKSVSFAEQEAPDYPLLSLWLQRSKSASQSESSPPQAGVRSTFFGLLRLRAYVGDSAVVATAETRPDYRQPITRCNFASSAKRVHFCSSTG